MNIFREIANNDIVSPALKAKLLTIVEYFLGAELDGIEHEPQELKDLVKDLIAYRNSPERTGEEKEEFDLYMKVIGPRSYSIHSSTSDNSEDPKPLN